MKKTLPDFARDPQFIDAYATEDRKERIRTGKVGCILSMTLVPAGITLDFFVYREHVPSFAILRFVCAALISIIWLLYHTSFGEKFHRFLGFSLFLFTAASITLMIYLTEGANSTYYAGLVLVLLAINAVMHWSMVDTLINVFCVLAFYLLACWGAHVQANPGILFNNAYFIILTSIIVLAGNYLFNQLHFREFCLRYELDKSRKKLIELDQLKSQFFANISHELRTPLTLMIAPLENLRRTKSNTLLTDSKDLLDIMYTNAMRLLKLINDLLDLVKLESGKIEIKRGPVHLHQMVQGIANSVQGLAQKKGVHLTAESSEALGVVMLDRDKIEKILLNLLFNALKFTPANGSVRLIAGLEGNNITLKVSDTGIGITPENQPLVFNRFWQANTHKSQGTGIGLALVKELTEAHGGHVSLKSTLGKGTSITVILPRVEGTIAELKDQTSETNLPIADSPSQGQEDWLPKLYRRAELSPTFTASRPKDSTTETHHQGTKPAVLVADDEPEMLRFIKMQLQDHFEIFEAMDGEAAVRFAKQSPPDLIVLDMMMPEKDGLQVCRELREQPLTRDLPIILLTAWADEETKIKALNAGATDFLTKPFSTTELLVRCHNLTTSHRLQKEIAKINQELQSALEQKVKDTESQLVQSAKMASLGQMSTSLIHEINNPLNYANSALHLLNKEARRWTDDSPSNLNEIIADIKEGIHRVKDIISGLRSFAHPDSETFESVSMQEVISLALKLIGPALKENINIQVEVDRDFKLWGNKNQLIHLFMNLLQNGMDSLLEKSPANEQNNIWVRGNIIDGKGVLHIRDNGKGIDSKSLDKIFDPFFTTKEVGKGMGLGLSICYRIVQQHGGKITVKSEPNQFCEFIIELPLEAIS